MPCYMADFNFADPFASCIITCLVDQATKPAPKYNCPPPLLSTATAGEGGQRTVEPHWSLDNIMASGQRDTHQNAAIGISLEANAGIVIHISTSLNSGMQLRRGQIPWFYSLRRSFSSPRLNNSKAPSFGAVRILRSTLMDADFPSKVARKTIQFR